jgi:hypothetical protein
LVPSTRVILHAANQQGQPARVSTTLEIYTDTDEEARREALTRLQGLLDQGDS